MIEPSKGPPNRDFGATSSPQLYNLHDDLAETTNLAERHPEKVQELTNLLDTIRNSGRIP